MATTSGAIQTRGGIIVSDKKGFIVVDIPKICSDCDFYCEIYKDIEACCSLADDLDDPSLMRTIDMEYCHEKPDWCPIKEFPEKKPLYTENGDRPLDWEFNVGWNACVTNMEENIQ